MKLPLEVTPAPLVEHQEPAETRAHRPRDLADLVDTALVLLDPQDHLVAMNGAACNLLNVDPANVPQAVAGIPLLLEMDLLRWAIDLARSEGESEFRTQLEDGHWYQVRACRREDAESNGTSVAMSFTDVTELVCDIEKARESTELYRGFVERARSITFRSALNFKPYFFHGAVEELTGYSTEAFSSGHPTWDQVIHPEDREARLADGAVLAMHPVDALEFEYRIQHRDGRERWVRESVHNICGPDGTPRWIQGSIIDISKRKAAEIALLEAQEHFRLAFATSPDAIAISRLDDGVYVDVNDGWIALSGFQRDQIKDRTDLDLGIWWNLEDRQIFARALREDRVLRNWEIRFRHRDGQEIITLCSAALLHLGGQTCILTLARDIRELKAAEQRLRDSEARYRLMAENASDVIARHDATGHFLYVSPAARRIFGYHPEELLGRSLVELVLPIQRPELENEFLSMQTTRDTRTRVFSIQHPDGAATWVEVAMRGMHDERDNLREIVTISRDVTERRQAEDERRRLELQFLQTQKLESLGVLAGGIAHDFNNLLVGILGNLDLARGESGLAPAVLGLLGDTERAARQAADLTNQMLAFSGRGSFEVQPVQLSALVQDMRQLLESVVARRARVEYALASDLPCVDADATQLRQVLLNLVTNAAEAIENDQGVIHIETAVGTGEPDQVLLRVRDNGKGMSPEVRDRVFEPFFTTKFTGRGLGMAAVRGIVHSHKGEILFESVQNKGSSFQVQFPASTSKVTDVPRSEDQPSGSWKGSGTVLLVDDDEIVLEVGQRMLRKLGFDILLARDGREALDVFAQHAGDIRCVILDLTMPGMDGEATYRVLHDSAPSLPVIVSSGYTAQDLQERFGKSSALAFIQKPYRTADIAEKLQLLLQA